MESKRVTCKAVYLRHKSKKGFKGYWKSTYAVCDIVDLETGESLLPYYEFANSFLKGRGLREGTPFTFSANFDGKKLTYPKYIK